MNRVILTGSDGLLTVLGGLLTAAGCAGLGFWYRKQFCLRIHHLRILCRMLEMMISQVRYSKAALPECCLYLSGRLEEPYAGAMRDVCETMRGNTGGDFGQVFAESMKECFAEISLGKEEKEIFLEFAGGGGFCDSVLQVNNMMQYRERLGKLCEGLENEIAEKSRMAVGLGVMGGLLLVIILM